MLSIKENYTMTLTEHWSTSGIQIDVSAHKIEELNILRKHIKKGLEKIERSKQ